MIKEPVPIARSHKDEGFDDRRKALLRRIKLLSALTGLPMTKIASELSVAPDMLSHMLSGRRNPSLSIHIDDLEALVSRLEYNAKRRGVDLPK